MDRGKKWEKLEIGVQKEIDRIVRERGQLNERTYQGKREIWTTTYQKKGNLKSGGL